MEKHGVSIEEAESVFEQKEAIRVLGEQIEPPVREARYGILGVTRWRKFVFVCFTIRDSKIRVIHVRKMNSKEEMFYEEICQKRKWI